ncbi:hypothetical protein [Shewanella carassii]|uniref:Uncharacterized protein n=1 Tax=Shewanella carassii TaxID=1987584 RepID=A0ABQ1SWJ2_9GAMM|nr:hypothetical protein [Shewanella carassii]GGE65596.1 hypothetical protein GCM10011520_02960 [Shewanella carassii]
MTEFNLKITPEMRVQLSFADSLTVTVPLEEEVENQIRELTAELFAARAHIELLHDAINKGDLQTARMAAFEFLAEKVLFEFGKTAQLAAGEFDNDEAPFGSPGGDE